MTATFAGTTESLADELGAALDGVGAPRPEVALVLGSGLGALADTLEEAHAVPFTALPSMPSSTVPGRLGTVQASLFGGCGALQGLVSGFDAAVFGEPVAGGAAQSFAACIFSEPGLDNEDGGPS